METVSFDINGGTMRLNLNMLSVAFISYRVRYWSSDALEASKLIDKDGNNKQPHDDSIALFNPIAPFEPIVNHRGRVVQVDFRVVGITSTAASYSVTVEVFQNVSMSSNTESKIAEVKSDIASIKRGDAAQFGIIVFEFV